MLRYYKGFVKKMITLSYICRTLGVSPACGARFARPVTAGLAKVPKVSRMSASSVVNTTEWYTNWKAGSDLLTIEPWYKLDELSPVLLEIQKKVDSGCSPNECGYELIQSTQHVGIVGRNKRFPEEGFYVCEIFGFGGFHIVNDIKRILKRKRGVNSLRKELHRMTEYGFNTVYNRKKFERDYTWGKCEVGNVCEKGYNNWPDHFYDLSYVRWYDMIEFWSFLKKLNEEALVSEKKKYYLNLMRNTEREVIVSQTQRFPANGTYILEFYSGDLITKTINELRCMFLRPSWDYNDDRVIRVAYDLFFSSIVGNDTKITFFNREVFETKFELQPRT